MSPLFKSNVRFPDAEFVCYGSNPMSKLSRPLALTVGTILFLIAKGIAWWTSFYKLRHDAG